jgi:membrane protein
VKRLRRGYGVLRDSIQHLNDDDGWAIASHIALSVLMAMFPFLIVLTALSAFVGSEELSDTAAMLMLTIWPDQVSGSIAGEVREVLTTARGGVLTIGIAFAMFFSASGVESLRIGLNRAYRVRETRSWLLLRLESLVYVMVGAVALLALGLLIVLAPLLFATAHGSAPWLARVELDLDLLRYAIASLLIALALLLIHKWLPAGRRRFAEIAPGILVTLLLWLVSGAAFGRYLADFAGTYVTYYAGLASGMIALSFLYLTAMGFVYGGELNSAIQRARVDRAATGGSVGEDAR